MDQLQGSMAPRTPVLSLLSLRLILRLPSRLHLQNSFWLLSWPQMRLQLLSWQWRRRLSLIVQAALSVAAVPLCSLPTKGAEAA